MRHSLVSLAPALLTLVVLLGQTSVCEAQGIWSPDIDKAIGPGPRPFRDAQPFSHWYNFGAQPYLFFNADPRQLYQLDYLDRVIRAERRGDPPPPVPRVLQPSYCPPPRTRWRIFGGGGVFFR
jgi:hypothetical protein